MPFTLPLLAMTVAAATATPSGQQSFALISTDNKNIGNITLQQGPDGIVMEVAASGLTPGSHGMHFHEVGDCSDFKEGFKKSGAHINPDPHKEHGLLNHKGAHPSDLPNIVADKDGNVSSSFFLAMLSMEGKDKKPALLDKDGSALIIHANPDDYVTQPIGGAGDRVACAAVKKLAQ